MILQVLRPVTATKTLPVRELRSASLSPVRPDGQAFEMTENRTPAERGIVTDAAIVLGPTVAVVATRLLQRPKPLEPPCIGIPPGTRRPE